MEKKFYRPDEVARRLSISKMTVYRLIKNKMLPACKIGRIYRIPCEALERLMPMYHVSQK